VFLEHYLVTYNFEIKANRKAFPPVNSQFQNKEIQYDHYFEYPVPAVFNSKMATVKT